MLAEKQGVLGPLLVAVVFSLGVFEEVGHLHLDGVVQVLLDLGELPSRAREEEGVQNVLVVKLLLRVLPLNEVCYVLEDLVPAVLGNDLAEVGFNVVINLIFFKLRAHLLKTLI